MIDIHAHILPGLDDGAESFEEAVLMARQAYDQGVTDIIATPHQIIDAMVSSQDITSTLKEFNRRLSDECIDIRVHCGAEILLDPLIPEYLDDLVTIGKYILLELPFEGMPSWIEHLVFELSIRGLTPIIAHPERNRAIAEDPNLLLDLITRGCLAQANAGSLLGLFGREAKRTVQILLNHNMIHLIGSDSHDSKHRRIRLADVASWVDPDLLLANPQRVLLNQELLIEEPIHYRKKRIFGIF